MHQAEIRWKIPPGSAMSAHWSGQHGDNDPAAAAREERVEGARDRRENDAQRNGKGAARIRKGPSGAITALVLSGLWFWFFGWLGGWCVGCDSGCADAGQLTAS